MASPLLPTLPLRAARAAVATKMLQLGLVVLDAADLAKSALAARAANLLVEGALRLYPRAEWLEDARAWTTPPTTNWEV